MDRTLDQAANMAVAGMPQRSCLRPGLADARWLTAAAMRRAVERRLALGDGRLALVRVDLRGPQALARDHGRCAVASLTEAVAARLLRRCRAADRAAVLGPGRVVLWLDDIGARADVLALLERLTANLNADDERLLAAVAVAVAVVGEPCTDPGELWATLDAAAAAAARGKPGEVTWSGAPGDDGRETRARRHVELRAAAADQRFFPVFQPQLDLVTGRFDRVEVLMRWRRPDDGIAGPAEFLDELRQLDLLPAVSLDVYGAALRQARAWLDDGVALARIALNLDVSQVRALRWAEPLLALVASSGLPLRHVEFELSEHILEHADIDVLVHGLSRLRAAGASISLDDFGAGYASLTQLARLPVDLVKLDARLVWGADSAHRTRTLVRGVVALTDALGLPCVFEGIETAAQLNLARTMGARVAQGYHLARPQPALQVRPLLSAYQLAS